MLFYLDDQYSQLPPKIAADPDGLQKEKALLERLASQQGMEAVRASERAHADLEGISANTADVGKLKLDAADEFARYCDTQFKEGLSNPAADYEAAAEGIDKRERLLRYYNRILDYAERVQKPLALLKTLEADAALAVAHCSVVSQQAMIACVERFIAAQPLLESEGAVTFDPGPGSRTGALIEAARDAYKTAQAASESVTHERGRQHSLRIGIFAGVML